MKKKKAPARAKPAPKKAKAKPAKAAKPAPRPAAKPVPSSPIPAPLPEPEKRQTLSLKPTLLPPPSRLISKSPQPETRTAEHAQVEPARAVAKSHPKPVVNADGAIQRLRRAKGFVLDLDGTLVLGDARNHGIRALPHALEFVAHLRTRKIPLVALTNGTIRTPHDIAEQLKAAGFNLVTTEILTPATVAAAYFTANDIHRVMVLGVDGSTRPLAEAGLAIIPPKKGERADAVFAGWFRSVTMDHIEAACGAVERGAKLFTASMAPYFATAEGRTLGTSCAIVGAVGAITGAKATVLGKPSQEALDNAATRMGVDTRDIAVIGDDADLEIPMAHAGGALAVGVTTGTSNADAFARAAGEPPHLVMPGIGDVLHLMLGK